jgi:hypothetical protein
MSRAQDTAVIAVFTDHDEARRAYDDLKAAGFRDDQIGYLGRNGPTSPDGRRADHAGEGVAAGAVGGGAVGLAWGLAVAANLIPGIGPVIAGGTIAALLASLAAGAAVGGAAGLLIGLGVPEEHAGYYERQLAEGRTLITVQAGERNGEALAILRRHALPAEPTANRDLVAGARA